MPEEHSRGLEKKKKKIATWCNFNSDVVNKDSDVVNKDSDVVNMANLETLAISASQDAFFAISTVSTVSTYRNALATLDAGRALFIMREKGTINPEEIIHDLLR